jgi:hypothetical protein
MANPLYIVMAYRWGWTNSHWHIVRATDDRDTAIAFASHEQMERGGKYGVAVHCLAGEDNQIVAYFPSVYGEVQPFVNHRIMAAEQVGIAVIAAVEHGTAFVADADGKCRSVPVRVPAWLKNKVERELPMAKALCKAPQQEAPSHPSPTPSQEAAQ